ncbi:MAG: hypothetical protein AAF527_07680 [Pseudomonadota bacterium]
MKRLSKSGRTAIAAALVMGSAVGACVSTGARSTIYDGMIKLGLSDDAASCFVSELDDRLSSDDLNEIASLVDAVGDRSRFFSAVRDAGEPDIAQGVTAASFACAFPDND